MKIPASYINELNQSNKQPENIKLDSDIFDFVSLIAKENNCDISIVVNYLLMQQIIAFKAKEKGIDKALYYGDLSIMEEDEIIDMINTYGKILIFEGLEEKSVILSIEEFKKIKGDLYE